MTAGADRRIALMDGAAALPRANGELVFAAPWEGRAFGLAVALSDARAFPWDDFRDRLIGTIVRDEAAGLPTTYYERWLAALESVVLDRGLLAAGEIGVRMKEIAEEDDHEHR
jgi:nitrile hydratase accessory protein